MSRSTTIQRGIGATMALFGALATVAPERFTQGPVTAQSENLTRMWALREVALGAILLATSATPGRRPVLLALTGLAAAECVVNGTAAALNTSQRVGSVAGAAAFGAAGAYAWATAGQDAFRAGDE
ncbi:hypothetical protein C6A87_009300 [Mycobacterium sp. ITM-2016-00317]|uniref:hypothetical protein n=1 Tax=Mycobacterium sp. ITM-2016-00317 TaxID=2099694 RepID=UPI00287F6CCB|nr:hypothetical protein [Mycobacterium sp. ITM-2016-00317]WNG89341.1 hypothetical protein C6A87_009300 [Mycobacterium sp. ITM-2016-00317]